jgi:hypothetical protein
LFSVGNGSHNCIVFNDLDVFDHLTVHETATITGELNTKDAILATGGLIRGYDGLALEFNDDKYLHIGGQLSDYETTGILFGYMGSPGSGTITHSHKSGIIWERTHSYARGTIHFCVNQDSNSNNITKADSVMRILTQGKVKIDHELHCYDDLEVDGSVSKGSGSFRIDHPLSSMKDTHHLVHSFTESPRADLIYRDKVTLVDGLATVNIDTIAGMTEGTFVLLCDNVQCFTSNESDWKAVKGSVSGNILTIECEDSSSTADVSWMVVGDRQDEHIMNAKWTDENGKPIIEPEKVDDEDEEVPD